MCSAMVIINCCLSVYTCCFYVYHLSGDLVSMATNLRVEDTTYSTAPTLTETLTQLSDVIKTIGESPELL